MAPRPPIQAIIEEQAELDTSRRNWRMVLFNEDGTPFAGGSGTVPSVWANLPLLNGHASYDGHTVQYRIEGDVLRLRGALSSVAATDYKFAEMPEEIEARITERSVFAGTPALQIGLGYGAAAITVNLDGLRAYLQNGMNVALLDTFAVPIGD